MPAAACMQNRRPCIRIGTCMQKRSQTSKSAAYPAAIISGVAARQIEFTFIGFIGSRFTDLSAVDSERRDAQASHRFVIPVG
jgi:hypothetical protein